jgi:ATP-binding cassette subfamily B protein
VSSFGAIVRRGGGWLVPLAVTGLAGTAVTLALPTVLGRTVDALVAHGDIARWLAIAGGLIAVAVVCDLVDDFADIEVSAKTTAWLRNRLVRRVLGAGPDRLRHLDAGDLVSRLSGNTVDAAQAGPAVIALVTGTLPPLGALVLLALIDWWLVLAFAAGVVLVVLVLVAFARRTADVFEDYLRIQAKLAARLTEALGGARTIAAAGSLEREKERVLTPLPELNDYGTRTWRVLASSGAQAAVVGPLALVAVLAVGGFALADGRISAGELFAASQYAVLGAGLGSLSGVLGELARARASVRRLSEVFAVEPTTYGSRKPAAGPGHLELRSVTVRADDGTVLLGGVSLTVEGGSAVAIVGPSGAGKSVLAAVAGRLRDPDEGQVFLDGVPLTELDHDALRDAIGCAFERPTLFGGSIRRAIELGGRQDKVVIEAMARATHAHEFVSRLPDGYETPLELAPMSGGERQRLGLARAWQADRLLVLDDATASLDMVTEMQIAQTLTRDRGGVRRTRLIVTHRAATAARADLVVWLDGGHLRAIGTHAELRDDPAYRELFR